MSSPNITSPKVELMTALSSIYKTGRFSDFTIICESRSFKVHKALLCTRSTFFDGAFSHNFLESSTGEIDLSDEEEEVVAQMVNYFYELDYLNNDNTNTSTSTARSHPHISQPAKFDLNMIEDPLLAMANANLPPSLTSSPTSSARSSFDTTREDLNVEDAKHEDASVSGRKMGRLGKSSWRSSSPQVHFRHFDYTPSATMHQDDVDLVFHAKMYAIAEKYGVSGLKTLALQRFESLVAENWNSFDFLDAIREIYSSTIDSDRGLRNVVIHIFRSHPELALDLETQAVVKEVPGFAFDLFKMHYNITTYA